MAASFYKRSVNTQANMKSGNILTVTVSIQIREKKYPYSSLFISSSVPVLS